MSELPREMRDNVVTECYRRAALLDWEGLSQRERSRTYDEWLDDPAIGKPLMAFLSRERARVWLKDVPMKEYARAVAGVGPYARFASVRLPGPEVLAERALGEGWKPVKGTLRFKPNRIRVQRGNESRLMLWGTPRGFRDLLWAAMVDVVDESAQPVIVLASTRAQHVSESERARHKNLGNLAGIPVKHTTVTPATVNPG